MEGAELAGAEVVGWVVAARVVVELPEGVVAAARAMAAVAVVQVVAAKAAAIVASVKEEVTAAVTRAVVPKAEGLGGAQESARAVVPKAEGLEEARAAAAVAAAAVRTAAVRAAAAAASVEAAVQAAATVDEVVLQRSIRTSELSQLGEHQLQSTSNCLNLHPSCHLHPSRSGAVPGVSCVPARPLASRPLSEQGAGRS